MVLFLFCKFLEVNKALDVFFIYVNIFFSPLCIFSLLISLSQLCRVGPGGTPATATARRVCRPGACARATVVRWWAGLRGGIGRGSGRTAVVLRAALGAAVLGGEDETVQRRGQDGATAVT